LKNILKFLIVKSGVGQEMGGDGGQPPAKRVRMGGNNGVGVPVTYHHQVQVKNKIHHNICFLKNIKILICLTFGIT